MKGHCSNHQVASLVSVIMHGSQVFFTSAHLDFLSDPMLQYQWRVVKQNVVDALWAVFKQKWQTALNREGAIRGEGLNKLRT